MFYKFYATLYPTVYRHKKYILFHGVNFSHILGHFWNILNSLFKKMFLQIFFWISWILFFSWYFPPLEWEGMHNTLFDVYRPDGWICIPYGYYFLVGFHVIHTEELILDLPLSNLKSGGNQSYSLKGVMQRKVCIPMYWSYNLPASTLNTGIMTIPDDQVYFFLRIVFK